MKAPVQWLLIGGPAHGKTVMIKAGISLGWYCGDIRHTYRGQSFRYKGALYQLGFHPLATHEQIVQITPLIASTGLRFITNKQA